MKKQKQIVQAMKCCLTNGKFALLLFSSILFFTACDSKLSRRDAEEKIIKKLNLPNDKTKDLTIEDQGAITIDETENRLKLLQAEGLVNYTMDYFRGDIKADLTEKGKNFAASDKFYSNYSRFIKVKVAKYEFGEITGIIVNQNTANVNFTIKITDINTFGKIGFNLKDETLNLSIDFSKFDDGWRINDYRYDNLEYINNLNRAFY